MGEKKLECSVGEAGPFAILFFLLLFHSLAESIIKKSKEKWGGDFLQLTLFSLPLIMWD